MYADMTRVVGTAIEVPKAGVQTGVPKIIPPIRKEPTHLLKVKRRLTVKPPIIKTGSMIGIVSPSAPAAGKFPKRFERGVKNLEAMGYDVRVSRHAKGIYRNGFTSASPEDRANDVNEMFEDEHVSAILCAIGGDHSSQILGHLDFDAIRRHPKVFQGYSDMSVLCNAIHTETGLVTFNGPMVMTDFAEYPKMDAYTGEYMLKAWSRLAPVGRIQPAKEWTEEFIDWGGPEDGKRAKKWQQSAGWTPQREGKAEGRLVGGCIESLEHLKGTRYWPDFDGAILFLETSEEKPLPYKVDCILGDYENLGVFDRIAGLIVGRPMGYSAAEKQQLRDVIMERTRKYSFPIITDMDFGHTLPQFTLPIGCRASIDTSAKSFEITEAAVQ